MAIHAFTSFSYSYLNRARVWAKSLRKHHPDWVIWAVITDMEPPGFKFDIKNEPFDRAITAEDLFGAETEQWLFGHDIVEACTAVKGRALQYILSLEEVEKVMYFDPDTAVFNSMNPIVELLNNYSIALTPHQIDQEQTSDVAAIQDNEIGSLKWGIFNLGFLAVNNDFEARRFATWWADRLYGYCYDEVASGLFVDQKWCNLIPCFFDRVIIIRDPGYNVASWNLSTRKLSFTPDGELKVNGSLLRFFHFTKLGRLGDLMTAKYAKENIEVYELWATYRRWISENSESQIPPDYWYYKCFDNKVPITKEWRKIYRKDSILRTKYQYPFSKFQEIYELLTMKN